MAKKPDYSKKILKILNGKSALPVPEIASSITTEKAGPYHKYAVSRSLKNLAEAGLVERLSSSQHEYARLTPDGRKRARTLTLENDAALVNTFWDGKWRIVLLDLPEERKSERESLRYLLKKAGFVCLKNSAWISPFPYEHLFGNIKKDLGLCTEMMIIVTDQIDEESKKYLFETFGR